MTLKRLLRNDDVSGARGSFLPELLIVDLVPLLAVAPAFGQTGRPDRAARACIDE